MGWTRSPGRVARDRHRPGLESLEDRQLLSQMSQLPMPAATTAAVKNSDGSTNFDQIIGASATRSAFGVDGTGSNVAVIDTGVNYQNPVLGGSIGPGNKVVAGVDFTFSPNGVLPTWQHGTGVAGIIGANASNYQGVAPGAGIVALRVFGDNNQGSFGNIEQALDWVVQHHAQYNITAVNLSISDGGNYQANSFGQDGGVGQAITGTIKQLDSMNIPVVVATGNSFNGKTPGEGFPATVPDTISVTATDASDRLASNAQRLGPNGSGSATTIAAPGVGITAPDGGNRMTTEDGTSFAAPQVTGSLLLLQQIYEKAFNKLPTVAQLESFLQQGRRDDSRRRDEHQHRPAQRAELGRDPDPADRQRPEGDLHREWKRLDSGGFGESDRQHPAARPGRSIDGEGASLYGPGSSGPEHSSGPGSDRAAPDGGFL
jgi:type VI secretion system secreted protein VgrG